MSADGISNRPTAIIRFKTSPIDAHFRREAHSLGIFLEKSEVFSNFAKIMRTSIIMRSQKRNNKH